MTAAAAAKVVMVVVSVELLQERGKLVRRVEGRFSALDATSSQVWSRFNLVHGCLPLPRCPLLSYYTPTLPGARPTGKPCAHLASYLSQSSVHYVHPPQAISHPRQPEEESLCSLVRR